MPLISNVGRQRNKPRFAASLAVPSTRVSSEQVTPWFKSTAVPHRLSALKDSELKVIGRHIESLPLKASAVPKRSQRSVLVSLLALPPRLSALHMSANALPRIGSSVRCGLRLSRLHPATPQGLLSSHLAFVACEVGGGYSVPIHSRPQAVLHLPPNPSIERTCPGKPGHASHLKR